MSDLSEAIEAGRSRRRSVRDGRMTRKARRALRRGLPEPGGVAVSCGCRFARTGGAWLHVWPCWRHKLGDPLSDAQMAFLTEDG